MQKPSLSFAKMAVVSVTALCSGVGFFFFIQPTPRLNVPAEAVDLGRIPLGSSSHHELHLKNDGGTGLSIHAVHSDCGCLRAFIDRDFVPSGGVLRLKVEADGVRVSQSVLQQIRIMSDAPGSPHIIKVHHQCVPERLTFLPAQMGFGRVESDGGAVSLDCRVSGPEGAVAGKLEASDPALLAAELIEPGRIRVQLTPSNVCGGVRELINLNDGTAIFRLPVSAFIVGPVFASPASLRVSASVSDPILERLEAAINVRSEKRTMLLRGCRLSPELDGKMKAKLVSNSSTQSKVVLEHILGASRSLSTSTEYQSVEVLLTVEGTDYRLRIPVEVRP